MQTFLPHPSFKESAKCLDRQRLGKQRVECKQILMTLLSDDPKRAWRNHPAVKMWKSYEVALCCYAIDVCKEWISRGYKDSLLNYFIDMLGKMAQDNKNLSNPPWLGNDLFHISHQSNLIRKDPERYQKMFPVVPGDLPYTWPTNDKTF